MALVAPGETTPKRVTVNGLDVEGSSIRYVQVAEDLNEISGLGLVHLSGIASFDKPATFRLQRTSENTIRVTTNTGVLLTTQWLGRKARHVEASTLDNRWLDITTDCASGSIPTRLVQEWSDRNQRMLAEFRISL
jgi:hypothetical protein